MAVASTFLVTVMMIMAVTSARQARSQLARDARYALGGTGCNRETLVSVHQECVTQAVHPVSYEKFDGSPELSRTIVGEYCSCEICDGITMPSIVECVKSSVYIESCSNSYREEILQQVSKTGGVCNGPKPADWLQKGLLNRLEFFPDECALEGKFVCETGTAVGGDRLDMYIDCLVEEVKTTCSRVTVFTMELVDIMIYESELGAQPSAAKLASLQNLV